MARQLSLIDLTDFADRKDEIAQQLLHAASDAGFFWITGHGISQEEIQQRFDNGDRFLGVEETRKEFAAFRPELFMGWRGLKDTKAAVGTSSWEQYLVAFNETYMQGIWPQEEDLPGFKAKALAFAHKANAVALQILSCFEQALQLPNGYFQHHLDTEAEDNRTLFGWNYYPDPRKSKLRPDQLRLLPHADTDVITLLFQKPGEPGLEILPGKDADQHAVNDPSGKDSYGLNGAWTGGIPQGKWTKMDPIPGAITVNIGNMLMRLSDNRLKSTYHRVRALEEGEASGERRSMVLFVHGRGSAVMQGPKKAYPAQTVAEMIAMNGNGYEKVKADKEWQQLVMRSQPRDQGAQPALVEVA